MDRSYRNILNLRSIDSLNLAWPMPYENNAIIGIDADILIFFISMIPVILWLNNRARSPESTSRIYGDLYSTLNSGIYYETPPQKSFAFDSLCLNIQRSDRLLMIGMIMNSEKEESKKLSCNYCGQTMIEDQSACPRCGTLSPSAQHKKAKEIQRKFILFFVLIVVFCTFMILWLPPDWIN